jgi:hypothetical protein
MVEVSLCIRKAMSSDAKPPRRSPRIAAKQAPAMPSTTAIAVSVGPQAKKMPCLGVRKHPHVERVYIYDPKHASYMLTRDEANTLGYWEFSEEDWEMIFLGEAKVSVSMLCNEMTDPCYRYGGLERAQRSQLKVEQDEFGCWNCNKFSSTLKLTRTEANALGYWPEFDEEMWWEWMYCCGPEEAVEVGTICDVLTPAHCKDAKRRAEAEVALAKLQELNYTSLEELAATPVSEEGRVLTGGSVEPGNLPRAGGVCVPPPPTPPLSVEEPIPPVPLLTPALLRQQAVDLPKQGLSPEASAWVNSLKGEFARMPSGKESIYDFIRRCEFIADLLQSILSSPYFVEVMRDSSKGCGLAKASLQAANNLTVGGGQTIEKAREELKFYRCPFSLKNQLNRHYKRIQDLVAIMRATVAPYIHKHD